MKMSVLIIITNEEGQVLLQHRDIKASRNPNSWGLWGGVLEQNESPTEAAKRELKEELGMTLDLSQLKIYKVYKTPGRERYVYYVRDDKQLPYHLQEGDDLRWVSIQQLQQLNMNSLSYEILKDFFNLKDIQN